MHSALSIASLLLAASGALALPQQATNATTSSLSGYDTSVQVVLQSQSTETGITTTFKSVESRKHKAVRSTEMFETINILVGADANQDLRCQALDMDGKPIIATRGANIDNTFSDGGPDKNEWAFATPSEVSRVICDPAFAAKSKEDFEIRVTLAGPGELATQTVFEAFTDRAVAPPTGSTGPYDTVDILVGAELNPDIRCKIFNGRGRPIVATRGENVDTTFSDGGPEKAEWTFDRTRKVSKIVCDESFVAAPQ